MKAIGFIPLLLCIPTFGQVALTVSPNPASQISGTGSPVGQFICGAGQANAMYIDSAISPAPNGRIWLCDQSSGSWAWDHIVSPIAVATSTTQISGSIIGPGCNTVTVTIPGAVPGQNGAFATPLSDPGNNLVTFTATITAANTITVKECVLSVLSLTPTPTYVRVLLY